MSMTSVALPHGLRLSFATPLVMGIINITPDSFSDGGRFHDPDDGIAHGLRLASEGADILDIGGESTRPGHQPVPAEEEAARVLPVLRALSSRLVVPLSIDSMKPSIAEAAIEAGASIINDVWGFQRDRDMARVAAETGALAILMHNRETDDAGVDMVAEVQGWLKRSVDIALAAGVAESKIVLDPGCGFGKTFRQNLELIRNLARIRAIGFPVLLGVSRKRFVGRVTGRDAPLERLAGTLAAGLMGVERGADVLRVHDVAEHVDALKMRAAIHGAGDLA
jgi:dihydropteroate synthase